MSDSEYTSSSGSEYTDSDEDYTDSEEESSSDEGGLFDLDSEGGAFSFLASRMGKHKIGMMAQPAPSMVMNAPAKKVAPTAADPVTPAPAEPAPSMPPASTAQTPEAEPYAPKNVPADQAPSQKISLLTGKAKVEAPAHAKPDAPKPSAAPATPKKSEPSLSSLERAIAAEKRRAQAMQQDRIEAAPTSTPVPSPPNAKPVQSNENATTAQATGMDDLVAKIKSVESALRDMTNELKKVTETKVQVEKEATMYKNKAEDLGERLSAMKRMMEEKEEQESQLKSKNKQLEGKARQLEQAAKGQDLGKSYNETLEGLQAHLQEAREHIEELGAENQELKYNMQNGQRVSQYMQQKLSESDTAFQTQDSDDQFKLTEAQRVSRFLEQKSAEIIKQHKAAETRIKELEAELESLQQKSSTMTEQASKKDDALENRDEMIKEYEEKLKAVTVEYEMSQQQMVGKYQALTSVEDALRRREPRASTVQKIAEVRRSLEESNELMSVLGDIMSTARSRTADFSSQIDRLEHRTENEMAYLTPYDGEAGTARITRNAYSTKPWRTQWVS